MAKLPTFRLGHALDEMRGWNVAEPQLLRENDSLGMSIDAFSFNLPC
jgi:hypothetical protein